MLIQPSIEGYMPYFMFFRPLLTSCSSQSRASCTVKPSTSSDIVNYSASKYLNHLDYAYIIKTITLFPLSGCTIMSEKRLWEPLLSIYNKTIHCFHFENWLIRTFVVRRLSQLKSVKLDLFRFYFVTATSGWVKFDCRIIILLRQIFDGIKLAFLILYFFIEPTEPRHMRCSRCKSAYSLCSDQAYLTCFNALLQFRYCARLSPYAYICCGKIPQSFPVVLSSSF